MGYSGRIVVARSERPLAESDAFAGVGTLFESTYAGGWRYAQLGGDPRGVLRAMVAATGGPVLTAYVLDSDMADVEALTPAQVSWHTYLHPDIAEEFNAPPLEQPLDEVTRQALAWSAEAGLTPDVDALAAALVAKNVMAEETLHELLAALGLQPA
jgi:hypothetical protein